jgi:DNA-binding MarR family transcriptional regulator
MANMTCCSGITLAQCHVILEVEKLGETTTKQLSENLKLDKSTLSRTVNGLKKLGLIKRGVHADDRRFTILKLTGKGKNKCDSLNKYNDNLYINIFKRLSQKEREYFFRSFNDVVQSFSEYCEEMGLC